MSDEIVKFGIRQQKHLPKHLDAGWFVEAGERYCFCDPCNLCPRVSSCENEETIIDLPNDSINIRRAIVARKGFKIVSIDYSGQEINIAANISKEATWITALLAGKDVHKATASKVWKIPVEQVTGHQRSISKVLNFGNLYGAMASTLSKRAGIPMDEATQIWNDWWGVVPYLKAWIEAQGVFALHNGYISTYFGRRRNLKWMIEKMVEFSSKGNKKEADAQEAFIRRTAANSPIQGSGADIIKIGMVRVSKGIKKEGLSDKVKMILQIHDELLFEVKDDNDFEKTCFYLGDRMIFPVEGWPVPMKVGIEYGDSWGKMVELKRKETVTEIVKEEVRSDSPIIVKINTQVTKDIVSVIKKAILESPGEEKLEIMFSGKVFPLRADTKVCSLTLKNQLKDVFGVVVEEKK